MAQFVTNQTIETPESEIEVTVNPQRLFPSVDIGFSL